jgi:hypothetical protein
MLVLMPLMVPSPLSPQPVQQQQQQRWQQQQQQQHTGDRSSANS